MNATAKTGVWEQTILRGIKMTCDTNMNLITVSNERGSNIRYHCPDGINISDIEQITNSILRTTTVAAQR